MMSPEDLNWVTTALAQLDGLLRGMADYRRYPDLLHRNDAQLDALLEHIVVSVRDARAINDQLRSRIDDVKADLAEDARVEALAAAPAEDPSAPAAVRPPSRRYTPPESIEQIYMANPTGMRELVLVADHEPDSLAQIETFLTDEDYRVLSVRDAFEAISIYARLWAAIDLVVLDFSMPGMSGDLVFDELQAINPKVAAVVSGGFNDPAKLNQMLGQGLKGFLPKPFEKEKVLRQIQQMIAHRPQSSGPKT